MTQAIPRFLVFGCFGVTAEIFFTAIGDFVRNFRESKPLDFGLTGKSYVWMFLIYGSAAVIFPAIYRRVAIYNVLARMFIYALIIFAVEYFAGWILEQTIGYCPWKYDSYAAVSGYIRLDYVVVWMVFGLLIEKLHLYLEHLQYVET